MSIEVATPTQPHPREVIWPEWVYPYHAGIVGGLIGGAAVALVGMGYGLISGNTWLPVNVVAAVVLRDFQTDPREALSRFDLLALIIGTVAHLGMSVGLGVMFSFILPALPGRPLYWGPVIGPLLWIGAFVGALPIINPVMAENIEIISFALANIFYGLALGWWIDRTPMIHVER
jgi:hypothetical protein